MAQDGKYTAALGNLRAVLARIKPGEHVYESIVGPREAVFAQYQPIFDAAHVSDLTKEEFSSFLYFENNHHWSGLYRQGLGAAKDLKSLRTSLALLLDESRPIRDRFPESLSMVTGLGKALASAILTVAYPKSYGVWNNTSEAAIRKVGLWPDFAKGEGIGGRYEKINALLLRLSTDLGTDLWTLDALWWYLLDDGGWTPPTAPPPSGGSQQEGTSFALEKQLEEFLLENWNHTPLAKEWSIYATPDDAEAGHQFPTDVGPIDILAKHKKEPRFLVIELKRNQSTDETVGQALRYVGWVQKHLAAGKDSVEALIIAFKAEKKAQYALLTLPNVRMMTYEVEFRLKEPEKL